MASKLLVVLAVMLLVICVVGVAVQQVNVENTAGSGSGVIQKVSDDANQALEDGPIGDFFDKID